MQSDLRIMRNSSRNNTPKATAVQDESVSNSAEKASAKKLRQARLPFKIITPIAGSKTATTSAVVDQDQDAIKESMDSRKRKLSNTANECANIDKEEVHNISKENVELLTATSKKKKLSAVSNNGTTSELIISLVDDEDENTSNDDVINTSSACKINENIEASVSTVAVNNKQKGAGTPLNDKSSSVTKLQIKLPLSSGKKKRRKSKLHLTQKRASDNLANELSSDEMEDVSVELNPQKRKKLSPENYGSNIADTNDLEQHQKMQPEQGEKGKISTSALIANNKIKSVYIGDDKQPKKETDLKSTFENDSVKTTKISTSSGDGEKQNEDKEDMEECAASDNEADDETDNLCEKPISNSSDVIEKAKTDSKSKTVITKSLKEEKNSTSSKNVTPKQMKLMEQRRKAREEKELKLQEEKTKKQQEKEEKEMAKKREREEREEQKRKEREEKEVQKRKEREEKERKRLADIEAKNEEKRKKNEAKEEELRKKEEERKRKEQEKEEAELKKKKAAQAFTKFFVTKTPTTVQTKNDDDSNTGDGNKLLAFRPFQIKGDMKMAPICRKILTVEEKIRLDDLLCINKTGARKNDDADNIDVLPKTQLYISDLRSGKILPGKWRRPSIESKDDVILVDELERVGQEIVEDTPAYVRGEMRVKFYKFHDNRRPPYYGTWRKKSSVVKPRKPFAQDMKFFDYEVDSDDEWEEEEPGESLEDGSDEDKEKESEDDDYEVDNEWFVPHGHLSDEELQNEDEFGMGDDNTREAQKVKLQLLQQEFAQEMKKKTEKIKPRLIGCIWADMNGNQPPECAKILWETLEKKSMLFMDQPLIEEPEFEKSNELNSPSSTTNSNVEKVTDKLKPIKLSDNMVKDLTRLVHGNNHAKNFLINEYIAYVEKTEDSVKNGGLRKPLKSVVRDKIDEIAEWQSVEASASHLKKMETNDKKKKKVKRRLCWVVKQEILDKMDLSLLELKNCWKYTLKPKFLKAENNLKANEAAGALTNEGVGPSTDDGEKVKNSEITQITKFAKVLTAEGKATKLKNTSRSTDKSSTEAKSNSPATPKEKKRVPLLMSVARGQQISTPAKNKLISQFLQQSNKETTTTSSPSSSRSKAVASPSIEDDVVILD